MLEFSELRAMARGLGLKSKAGWQRWVREKRKEGDKVALASYVEVCYLQHTQYGESGRRRELDAR